MRIRRAILIPAILTLTAAGSVLAGSAAPMAAAQAPGAHALATASSMRPAFVYDG